MAGEQNAGSIVYEISAEVAPLLQGGRQASRTLTDLESSVNENINSFKKLDTQLSSTAKAVNEASNSSGKFRSTFQQAGYQIQDFIVQVQGGQSALVAFSQQGSQLAGAFGPGGAVVGAFIALASVLTGVLMTAMGSAGNEMEKLEKAATDLNKIVVINSQGVAALSNDYARLAVTNAALATQLRDAAIAKYAAEVEKARSAISNIVDQQSSWLRSINGGAASVKAAGNALEALSITTDSYSQAMSQAVSAGPAFNQTTLTISNTVEMLADKFSISRQSAFELIKMLNDLAANPSPENVTRLSQAVSQMSATTSEGKLALSEFREQLTLAGASAANAEQAVKDLENQLSSLRTEAQQANFDNISKQLEAQRIALTKGRQAAVEYGISQQDLTQEQKDQLIQQSRVVNGLEEEKKAREEAERAAQRQAAAGESVAQKLENLRQKAMLAGNSTQELSREQSILNAQQSLGKAATQAQIDLAGEYAAQAYDTAAALKAQQKAEKDRQDTEKAYQNVRSQSSPLIAADNTFQQQMASLNAYAQLYPQKIAEVEQTRATIEEQYRQQRINAMWSEWAQQNEITEAAAAAFDSLAGNASNALTGIITGSMTAQDALRSIGSTVLNSLVNSFVQMGVEWAKNAIIGATTQQAAIAATTATQVSALATTTAASTASAAATTAAWTPAAIVASIGSFGGAAAVGLGAVVAALALSGKRKNGGPVSAGGMYQVGEGGMPEIYQASTGKQYIIPGDNGRVISNKEMTTGAGGGVVINIQNYTSSSVDAQAGTDGNGGVTVDVIVADLNNGGPISNAITSNMNVKRTPRGQG
ncbi:phage tail protein [Cronobacter sakazakii]|uniref:phage tail protein n=1 Tax=Cronobacter sakazakii TaxID=28141 RepID=UPI0029DEBF09|nr:phage tail protein [Cronobacter sakazakii]ELY4101237.1 phage tail protein [Cronobacter sakazakii]ELY4595850.1 phage tail protein [Cronobacter sakazakii]ELY4871166.1 phage tail protein [Cronobacter sakazakii]MEB8574970.1 phage tail protein [Cronobacter sakazakii]